MGVFARRKPAGDIGVDVPDVIRHVDGSETIVHTGSSQYASDDYKSPHGLGATPNKKSPFLSELALPHHPHHLRRQSDVSNHSEGDSVTSDGEPEIYIPRRKWRSSRLIPGEVYEKPWLNEKIPHRQYEIWIFIAGCTVGALIGSYLLWDAWTGVINHEYCNVLIDDFKKGINMAVWNFEVQRGGFGTGSFEWTTYDKRNVYTDDAGLHIVPTLTLDDLGYTEAQLLHDTTLNLTVEGTCTSKLIDDCGIRSDETTGAMVNPVRSGRLNTKGKMSIKYGKVEVEARIPRGDWLWPAIWMMPRDDVYGAWPRSGEIDIMEARGNAPPFPGGRNQVLSALHWGPIFFADGYWRTLGQTSLPRGDFSDDFHTYRLEWGPKYLFTSVGSRLLQVIYVNWPKEETMWERGQFERYTNQSALDNPWPADRPNAPFDQEFYLILNVAVGGTNGFFVDSQSNKPWIDRADGAQRAFWNARNSWYPTWGEGDTKGMTVREVRMYTYGACKDKSG